jgi:hydroxymethylpyrimidine pyrophosphatase-like HAD family hydrolase
MALTDQHRVQLQYFFDHSRFSDHGAVITDLDGTAIHEFQGQYSIPPAVEGGMKKIYDLGRPIVINSLRFPLNVMRTFGRDWYRISNLPIPTVLMNGSQLGYIFQDQGGTLDYEEIAAFPLEGWEVDELIRLVGELLRDDVSELLVFFYPRAWQKGEIIWTPKEEKLPHVLQKYMSASLVFAGPLSVLEEALRREEICMIFLLIDLPQDKLMAYQHARPNSFFTRKGVDKAWGARQMARHLGFHLDHSVGAGDTDMDTFLQVVGQAVHVGHTSLDYRGLHPPIKVSGSTELGELLAELASLQKTVV